MEDGPVLRSVAYEGAESHQFFNGRLLGSPQIDFNLIKGWMRRCDVRHKDCKPRSLAGIDDILLIDIENLTVGSAPPLSSYTTLSYARDDLSLQTIGGGGELPDPLPKSFDDAITVIRALEIRYLWIDAYCLPAGEGEEERKALAAMGNIYQNSILTIVGAYESVESGLPSVSLDSRPVRRAWIEINGRRFATMPIYDGLEQKWNKWCFRAWTHQEVALARRCVYFGLHHMYVECKSESFAEFLTEPWGDERAKAQPANKIQPRSRGTSFSAVR
jgi:Heterokaryon incompatibility protein (HET)